MPVKITAASTNPNLGEISKPDLDKMKNDFISQVDLNPANGRTRIIKKFSVSVMKQELAGLLEQYNDDPDFNVLTFNFAVNVNPTVSCNGIDISDSITVVVEASKFTNPNDRSAGLTSYNNINDHVVIPAYADTISKSLASVCCPSSHP